MAGRLLPVSAMAACSEEVLVPAPAKTPSVSGNETLGKSQTVATVMRAMITTPMIEAALARNPTGLVRPSKNCLP